MRATTAARVALVALLAAAPVLALAQAAPPPDLAAATIEDLMKLMVTTASRGNEDIASAPARVQVITAAQIERRGYRSLLDVLRDLPDFKVDLRGDPDYPAEVTVQGTRGSSRIVLLLDGIRISSPTNEPLPMVGNYPVHNARQVEIVYGPASALYGADAFSAVVNVISKDVAEAPGLTATGSVGQYGLYTQTASYGARLSDQVSLMLSGQFHHDQQPDMSRYYPADFQGLQSHRTGLFNTIFGPMQSRSPVSPDYDIPTTSHAVQARLRAGGLVLALFQSRARISNAPSNTPDNGVYNAEAFNDNRLLVGSAAYTRPIGRFTSTSTVAFSRHELDPQSGYWNAYSNLKKSFKYAYGSMIKAEEQLSWKPRPYLGLTVGATVESFFAIPQGADLNAPVESQDLPGTILDTSIPDAFVKLRYTNTGVLAQLQYVISPRAALTLGARGDYNTRFGGTVNPRMGLVVRPTDQTTLKVMYGTAFLSPSPYQAYGHYGSFYSTDGGNTFASSYWHLPNPDLKPQTKQTVETQVTHSLGSHVQLSGSAFFAHASNLVKYSDPDASYAGEYLGWPVEYIDYAVNSGRAITYGGSLGLDYLWVLGADRRIEVRAAAVLVEGRDWATDQASVSLPTGAMSPIQIALGTDIDWGRWQMAPRLSVVGRQRLVATSGEGNATERRTLDGYMVFDVNIRRQLSSALHAFVTVENAFDRRYRTVNTQAYLNPAEMIGSPQNPRRIAVGVTLRMP